jgi:hypothetical protein
MVPAGGLACGGVTQRGITVGGSRVSEVVSPWQRIACTIGRAGPRAAARAVLPQPAWLERWWLQAAVWSQPVGLAGGCAEQQERFFWQQLGFAATAGWVSVAALSFSAAAMTCFVAAAMT